jgi:hypothetical protein
MLSESLTGAALDAAIEDQVFGDDLTCGENRERLQDATAEWWDIHQSDELGLAVDRSGFKHMGLFAWEHRDPSPWHESLEAHVSAYRAAPRPFHRDLRLAMGLLGKEFEIIASGGSVQVMIFVDGMVTGEGAASLSEFPDADEAEQRVLATCAAICRAVLSQQIDEIEASSLAAATRAAKSRVGTHHHDRLVSVYEKDAGTGDGQ